jgi:hypothetical protein
MLENYGGEVAKYLVARTAYILEEYEGDVKFLMARTAYILVEYGGKVAKYLVARNVPELKCQLFLIQQQLFHFESRLSCYPVHKYTTIRTIK